MDGRAIERRRFAPPNKASALLSPRFTRRHPKRGNPGAFPRAKLSFADPLSRSNSSITIPKNDTRKGHRSLVMRYLLVEILTFFEQNPD